MRQSKKKPIPTENRKIAAPVPPPPLDPAAARRATLVCLGALGLLVLLLFRWALWQTTHILGADNTDMAGQFVAWRSFGFGELKNGHFPLWNPYLYAGEPYFGGMQSALLYPPNVIFLVLPLNAALNWSIAINMWLLGAFMFAWGRMKGLSHAGAFLAGAMIMFCGAYAPHVYAGHLPNLCTMPWAPLILLAIDGWIDRRHPKWLLLGIGAVAVQILAGHIQYVFFTAIAAGVYALARLVQTRQRVAAALGLLAIYPAGAALAGVQLLAAFDASGESVRSGKLYWLFVSSFSFPPENFLTAIAPHVYGTPRLYFGKEVPWEMSLFVGTAGVAAIAAAVNRSNLRRDWPVYTAIAVTLLLALGKYTPLLYLLYQYVPGFDWFRGYSKFIFQASLFLALLAGVGLDGLRARPAPRLLVGGFAILGALLFLRAWIVANIPQADWAAFLAGLGKPDNFLGLKGASAKAAFPTAAHACATVSLIAAAASCAIVAAILAATRSHCRAWWALFGFAVAELLVFANSVQATFTMKDLSINSLPAVLEPQAGDERVLIMTGPNAAMILRRETCWGDDPSVTRRYAEFVVWVNGSDPNQANQNQDYFRNDRRSSLMRLSGAYIYTDDKTWVKSPSRYPILPRAFLVGRWYVARNRDEIFSLIAHGPFDPWKEALLETHAGLGAAAPGKDDPGPVRVLENRGDALVIEATANRPAILVVSDAYAKGWRARSLLAAAPQPEYKVMPANYWMRGIPLKPGKHKILLEYKPRAFVIGAWISMVALIVYAGTGIWLMRRRAQFFNKARS